jgi:hypothetical protein
MTRKRYFDYCGEIKENYFAKPLFYQQEKWVMCHGKTAGYLTLCYFIHPNEAITMNEEKQLPNPINNLFQFSALNFFNFFKENPNAFSIQNLEREISDLPGHGSLQEIRKLLSEGKNSVYEFPSLELLNIACALAHHTGAQRMLEVGAGSGVFGRLFEARFKALYPQEALACTLIDSGEETDYGVYNGMGVQKIALDSYTQKNKQTLRQFKHLLMLVYPRKEMINALIETIDQTKETSFMIVGDSGKDCLSAEFFKNLEDKKEAKILKFAHRSINADECFGPHNVLLRDHQRDVRNSIITIILFPNNPLYELSEAALKAVLGIPAYFLLNYEDHARYKKSFKKLNHRMAVEGSTGLTFFQYAEEFNKGKPPERQIPLGELYKDLGLAPPSAVPLEREQQRLVLANKVGLTLRKNSASSGFPVCEEYTQLVETAEKAGVINQRSSNGNTALHWAIKAGDIEKARILLTHGADPALQNKAGEDAYALARKHAKSAELLTVLGVHPNLENDVEAATAAASQLT